MKAAAVVKPVVKPSSGGSQKIDKAGKLLRADMISAKEQFIQVSRSGDKEALRDFHVRSKQSAGRADLLKLENSIRKYGHLFADGATLDPSKIDPCLMPVVRRDWTENIFRLVRATWSLPFSKGYGRRLRFIVFDRGHNAVMGVIGLQSAPIDLACRDALIPVGTPKLDWVNSTMEAYTLGAIDPYRELLAGKLVAGLVSSEEVGRAYWAAYVGRESLMRKRKSVQPLLAVTTASAFGRSSIYNRLSYGNRLLAEPIGYTKGYGLIHLTKDSTELIALHSLNNCNNARFVGSAGRDLRLTAPSRSPLKFLAPDSNGCQIIGSNVKHYEVLQRILRMNSNHHEACL